MSQIKPFKALRPLPERARKVAAVPYDVVSREEAREIVKNNPLDFLHVTRAEIDLSDNVNPFDDDVYERARQNLRQLREEATLHADSSEAVYIYRLESGEHDQTAVVALCSLDEYDTGLIKKHEKTRPEKENDRTRHIIETRCQTGLIFLCYKEINDINLLVKEFTKNAPLYDVTATDGVRHKIWRVTDSEKIVEAFEKVPALYIADGHHRAAAAARAREELKNLSSTNGAPPSDFVLAAMFPAEQLQILAYNRVVRDFSGLSEDEFLQRLSENFVISETATAEPTQKNEFCFYTNGKWRRAFFNVQFFRAPDPIDALDVSILQRYVLEPIFGIADVRTDKRIDFVGGIRGTRELERLVDSGEWKIAFSLAPTTLEELLTIADAGEIMPPKSTWFEPKLRDGLLAYEI